MKIIKVFNNNVVATTDPNGEEVIVTGAGIGFRKRVGDTIAEDKISQWFYLRNDKKNKFYTLLERTPIQYFEIAETILQYATKHLKKEMNDNVLVALTDHIAFAISRKQEGIELPNLILDEIKMLYNEEFKIGIWAVDYIEEKTGIRLAIDEAGYIALHIVNASFTVQDSSALDMIDVIRDIIDIIESRYDIEIAKNSLDYSRLMIHLKFFIQRIVTKEHQKIDIIDEMYSILVGKNDKLFGCVNQINKYIEDTYSYTPSDNETVYLMIHILRIVNKGL